MSTSKPVARTPGETFRRRMSEARKLHNLTQRGLVARLHDKGLEINQAAIARIESGERKVSLDEAVAIAAVLDQAPMNLFLATDDRTPVLLAPAFKVDQATARRWAAGGRALDPENFEPYLDMSPADAVVVPEGASEEQRERWGQKWTRRLSSIGHDPESEERN
jgi:transcriptional regulator with XRE-family HTH domain